MCILFVGWKQRPNFPLIVAANRDEFYTRPTEAAKFWSESKYLLAGRDLEAGGTWLGVTNNRRFAALTNYREPNEAPVSARSRGLLVTDFLHARSGALEHARQVRSVGAEYAGFSLLLYDGEQLVYCSNRSTEPRALGPGQYGLSNHLLDTDWPKINQGKAQFDNAVRECAQSDELFALLRDRTPVPVEALPDTGVGAEWERVLSPIFVATNDYGTRSSTCVKIDVNGFIEFEERTFERDRGDIVDPNSYKSVRYRFLAAR